MKDLSYAVLQPETTCEQLREDFGLADLPAVDNPADVGMKYQEHRIPAPDGERLRVWYMPAAEPRGTVVVSPGNSGPMACYLFTARLLTSDDYSVVMYDYEGFGGSTGEPDLVTLRPDLEAVVQWARETTGSPQVTLFGMSLGSIPTVAAAIDLPGVVNAVILDSPVALGAEIERFGFLVRGRSQEIIAALEPWLITENVIEQMRQSTLVFMHGDDAVTPPDAVSLMLANAGAPIELVYFEGLGHAAGQFLQTDEYNSHLADFLSTVWPE
jgi:pimeloyl-ACP methyl ester carboxylesterase